MSTQNRRVAAYLPPGLDDRLKAFIVERELKGDSQALIVILSEFFGVSQEVTHQSGSLITSLQDRVEALEEKFAHIKSGLYSELRIELLEHHNSSIEQTKGEVKDELLSELRSKLPMNTKVPGQLELIPVEVAHNSELLGESKDDFVAVTGIQLEPMPGRSLSKRFGFHEQAVTNAKGRSKNDPKKFIEWSKSKDPDGVAWEYRDETKLFHPLSDQVNPLPEGSERSEEG